MRVRYAFMIAGILAAGCGSRETITWQNLTLDQALAAAGDRLVMVDFITDN
ncbi:MAG: hypothetical protein JSW54_10395 [Fidelibacterota bacterium]|nr:MAG: hypothetical protein JSW54_10395 [Candidatus Neomarinimicrobiota bacterium]